MNYDVLITSGTILDGSGENPQVGDIGIEGDRIVSIGNLGGSAAPKRMNALGKFVTPGFIDMTNHSDTHLTFFQYPGFESFVTQGVTSVIGGNCGASLAPLASHTALGAVKKWADPSKINVNWSTTEEFLHEVERIRLAVNFGMFVGYGTLRRGVINNEIRLLTFEEREKVRYLLTESMRQGAFGLSMGLSYGHERVSTTEEIIDIVNILPRLNGVLKMHLRSEGAGLMAAVNEAIRIGRETGVSIQISHLKTIGRKSWASFQNVLELIARARESGVDVNFDISPYATTGSLLYLLTPAWARSGGLQTLFATIDDAVGRRKIIEELKTSTLHYDRILITSAKMNTLVGRTMEEIAQEAGLSPEEALIDIVRVNEGRVSIVGGTVSRRNMARGIADPLSFVTSDGEAYSEHERNSGNLVHPRCFGAFPHFWHGFVRDAGAMRPETAIQKITSGPARKLGIQDRGILKNGNFADVVIFDPILMRDRAGYRDPFHYAIGIDCVIINGQSVIEDGAYTGSRPGKLLQK